MRIQEWFNPEDEAHLKAYVHLGKTGLWPKDFLPDNIQFSTYWNIDLLNKMALLWIKNKLNIDR